MTTDAHNPSALFSAYNFAKSFGRQTGRFDSRRVDRALEILMSGNLEEKIFEYGTTTEGCGCPDWQYRTIFCKHRIAKLIQVKHDEIMETEIWSVN